MAELKTFFGRQSRGKLPDELKQDLADLLKISRDARIDLARTVPKVLLLRTAKERQALEIELDSKWGKEPVALRGPLRLLLNFAAIFLDEPDRNPSANDEPEALASDLAQMDGVLPRELSNAEAILSETLKVVKESALSAKQSVQRLTFATGVLPAFNGIGTTVELRAIMDSEYRWGDDVGQYQPSFSGLVGVASVRIALDSGNPKDFIFQASDEDLTRLIDSLRATQKELRLLEQRAKLQ